MQKKEEEKAKSSKKVVKKVSKNVKKCDVASRKKNTFTNPSFIWACVWKDAHKNETQNKFGVKIFKIDKTRVVAV
jgi:hypothetical protein